LAFGRDVLPDFAVSVPLGAGRITGEFLGSAPIPSDKLVKALGKHMRRELDDVGERIAWEGQPRRVVATSKTFKQLARLCAAAKLRKGSFVRRILATADLAACLPCPGCAGCRRPNVRNCRGVSTPRAGQVLAAAIVALQTPRYLDVDEVELSPWALREGIIFEHLAALTDTTALPLQPLDPSAAAAPTATVTTLPTRR